MFVPVACRKCGKPFQVPSAAAGTEVDCPWCNERTPALPVAGVTPAAPREVLSLDDDDEPPPRSPGRKRSLGATLAIGLVVVVVTFGLTMAAMRFGSGDVPPTVWNEFTAPDGSCSIQLPGTPEHEHVDPSPADTVTRGLDRFTTIGWYSRAKVWFGWRDLDPGFVKQTKEDRDGAMTTPVLTAERDRRRDQVNGKIVKEATVRFGPHLGLQVEMETPRGKLVERYIAATGGSHPRLYFMGVESKTASPEGSAAQRLFNSFRVLDK
jgi:hypothetical protein